MDVEGGQTARVSENRGDVTVFLDQLLVIGRDVVALDLGYEDAQVADLDVEGDGLRFPLGVLPNLETATALEVGGDAGVAALGLVSRVGEHQLRHGVVFQHPDIHLEHIGIPFPRFDHIFRPDADLLYSYNIITSHCTNFLSRKDNKFVSLPPQKNSKDEI